MEQKGSKLTTINHLKNNRYQHHGKSKQIHKRRNEKKKIPLKAMPEDATTQVWMTVFSCLVKGCLNMPDFSKNLVQVFTKKNPRRPAETLREGIIPVVRLSFITMKLNNMLSTKLTAKALRVNWFLHDGTRRCWNTLSTEISSSLSLVLPFRLSPRSWSSTCSTDSKPFSTTLSPLPF